MPVDGSFAVIGRSISWRTLAGVGLFLALVLVMVWPAPARASTLERLPIKQFLRPAITVVDGTAAIPAIPAHSPRQAAWPPKYFWGHVSDSSDGEMIPGAVVKATQPGTSLVYTTTTDAGGYYRLDLNPDANDMFGKYDVEFSAAGYVTKKYKLWLSLLWHEPDPANPANGSVDEALTPSASPTPTPTPTTSPTPPPSGVIFYDGFEGSTSAWTLEGDPTWAVTTYRAAVGQHSAYCAGSRIAPPGPYADNMNAWLIAGPFDLSAVSAATFQYKVYYKTQASVDLVKAFVSTDNKNFYGNVYSADSQGWIDKSMDLTAVPAGLGNVCGKSQVWIAFLFTSDASIVDEGAFVDEVKLLAGSSPTPTPTPTVTPTPTPAPTPGGDTVGPVCGAKNVTVVRGKVCKLFFRVHDAQSTKVKKHLVITTKSGVVKKNWSSAYGENFDGWWYMKYTCRLPRGSYLIVVTGEDLAGNSASVVGRGTLRVK
ncbi:MAG: carboxypeptidase regulatory-like domain-containing protein [Actinobacteria bacterium]|nr:carboxypeptidase regulatory-like domain-containing protein [Actinomycetota bacterium]